MGNYIPAGQKRNIGVKLVEPSIGNTIELKVVAKKEFHAGLCMEQLIDYAMGMQEFGAQWTQSGKTIKIVFPDGEMAENAREHWRRYS